MKRLLAFIAFALLLCAFTVNDFAHASDGGTVPPAASKAFDSCFSCNGQDPDQAWFTAEHAAGYSMMILDPDTWNSEFPDGNADDPGPAKDCRLAADSKQIINNAITSHMKVGLYNRNLRCWKQSLKALGPQEHDGTPVYVWDVETTPGLVPTAAEVLAVTKLGFTNVTYTWQGAVSKSLAPVAGTALMFNQVNSWNGCSGANCGAPAQFPAIDPVPAFNGWTSAVIEQDSTGNLGGYGVDYDSVNTAWLGGLR